MMIAILVAYTQMTTDYIEVLHAFKFFQSVFQDDTDETLLT